MPEIYANELWRAAQALMFAAIAGYSFKTAKEAALTHGRWWSAWRGGAWALGIALVASVAMGTPSCEDPGSSVSGGCDTYADDGYDPTFDQRASRFLFLAILMGVPAVVGAASVGEHEIAKRRKDLKRYQIGGGD